MKRASLAERLERRPVAFLLLFTAIYLIGRISSNLYEPFWFDEIINYNLASLPSIGQIWPLIGKGIELNPPLPFWLTWMVHHTWGGGEAITRLPAVVGYWLMCVCLFQFVRRRSDTRHGFIALLVPVFTYTSRDATFARGYGLMLGASAAALLSWQYATSLQRRTVALICLGLSIATAVSCHYYAVYVALALLLGESLRWFQRGRLDGAVLAAIGVGLSPLYTYRSLVQGLPKAAQTFWISPNASDLYSAYADLLGPTTIILFFFLLLSLRKPGTDDAAPAGDLPSVPEHEWLVMLLLLAMPLVVFSAALLSPVAFYTRYVQPVVIGFAPVITLFAWRVAGRKRWFGDTAVTLLVCGCLLPWVLFHCWRVSVAPPPGHDLKAHLQIPPGADVIAFENDNEYLCLFHYAGPELRRRLFFPVDAAAAIQYLGSDTALHSLALLQTFHDVHAIGYGNFVKQHHQFLLIGSNSGWLIQKLVSDGARLELVRETKNHGYFNRPVQLFRVTVLK